MSILRGASKDCVMGICALALFGCGDNSDRSSNSQSNAASQPIHAPEYTIPPEIRDAQPDIAKFLRAFLETCLTGDYPGYRKFVSRREQPETQDRFKRIYDAIEHLTVQRVEEVQVAMLPAPTFVVVSSVTFVPGRTPVFGEDRREIAIIVFREEGEWRMLPAPSRFQPERRRPDGSSQPASQPDEPTVEYPWEEYGEG